jgi:uncharacterized membrane protein YgcG
MNTKLWLAGLTVTVSWCGAGRAAAAQEKELPAFGALETTSAGVAKTKALAWLKQANPAKLQEGEALWNREDRSALDNLADTFALGDAEAAKLLALVRDDKAPPPVGMPAILQNAKADPFLRANLGLAVARHLSNRRVHEEALAILNSMNPEQTIDPAAYLFHRSICEHALLKRDEANRSIVRLIQDAGESPERYKTVAALMLLDMQTWKKDLGNVARLMNNSERRLDVGRAGPETQKIQKEVIARLDEMIKELENKVKKAGSGGGGGGGGDPNGGSCPDGGSSGNGGGANPTSPMQDSQIATNGGSGKVELARIQKLTENWGKMEPAERARAMAEVADLVSGLSPEHRQAFERYFEQIRDQPSALPNKK